MNIIIRYTVLIILMGLTSSCEKLFFNDLSKTTRLVFDDLDFNTVHINDSFNLHLVQDSVYKIIMEVSEELAENMEYLSDGDTAKLYDHNSKKWLPSYTTPIVYIHFPVLDHLRIRAPGHISTIGTIQQKSFSLLVTQHTGQINLNLEVENLRIITGITRNYGQYIISGTATEAYLWMRSACSLDAYDLNAENTRIINNTINYTRVRANSILRTKITASGNVYYQGTPHEIIIEEQSSSGRLINDN